MATEQAPESKQDIKQADEVFSEQVLSDLFSNPRLTDMSLNNPDTHASVRVHKAILASGSQYFLRVFCQSDLAVLTAIEVPRPVGCGSGGAAVDQPKGQVSDEIVGRILKYIYHNQDFNVIKAEINEGNVAQIYSQAFVMQCTRLLKCLDDLIIHELLHPENASHFYLDAIRFDNKVIAEACEALLQQHIDSILATDKGTSFLLSLPYDKMHSLCNKSSLCVTDEKELVMLFTKYLEHREALPLLPEEDPWLDWKTNGKDSKNAQLIDQLLSEEEKEKRKAAQDEEAANKQKEKDESEAAKKAAFDALEPLGRIQSEWNDVIDAVHKASTDRLKLNRLSKAEKIELFKTIRYSFMKHEDLLALTTNTTFELAKQFIIEGLSVRLNPFENGIKDSIAINIEPRANYNPALDQQQNQYNQQKGAQGAAAATPAGGHGQAGAQPANLNNVAQGLGKSQSTPGNQNAFGTGLKRSNFENYYERKLHEEREGHNAVANKLLMGAIGAKIKDAMHTTIQPGKSQQPAFPGVDDSAYSQQHNSTMVAGHARAFGATMKPSNGPIPPMKPHSQQLMDAQRDLQDRPYEFLFQSHFDEEGALFYLGSFGKRRLWQNPHTVGQVVAFSSSIGSGRPEDLVGRQVVNCRTGNEPFSYYGVDLGEQRQLLPTCYSLRNRNSPTHVLLNWHFEGSNDKVNWTVLDRRLYLSGNPAEDAAFEEEKKLLCQKGAVSTWGVDTDIYREIGFDGFRYFRVIQVGKNSSGSDNMALSGFELYGRVICGRWP